MIKAKMRIILGQKYKYKSFVFGVNNSLETKNYEMKRVKKNHHMRIPYDTLTTNTTATKYMKPNKKLIAKIKIQNHHAKIKRYIMMVYQSVVSWMFEF